MAEMKKSNKIPAGWSVLENDGTTVESVSVENIEPLTQHENEKIEQLIETLGFIEQMVADGKIDGFAFAFIGPEGSSAGYGWTAGCEEHGPLALANIELMRQHLFRQWQTIHDDADD